MYKSRYRHKQYQLQLRDSKGVIYGHNQLLFSGNRAVAISMFIKMCNDPQVTEEFKEYLEALQKSKRNV
jgi:hypothetical protein